MKRSLRTAPPSGFLLLPGPSGQPQLLVELFPYRFPGPELPSLESHPADAPQPGLPGPGGIYLDYFGRRSWPSTVHQEGNFQVYCEDRDLPTEIAVSHHPLPE